MREGGVARLMVQNGKAATTVRHVDLKWWFANHHVEQGHVHVGVVDGATNPVNGLTKLTSGAPFVAERAYLLGLEPGPKVAAAAGLIQLLRASVPI